MTKIYYFSLNFSVAAHSEDEAYSDEQNAQMIAANESRWQEEQ